jgi:hypothetical protein
MQKRLKIVLIGAVLFFGSTVWARQSQFAFRIGPVYGNYHGPIEGDFYVPGALDMEYSTFMENDKALIFRAMLALELPESKPYYTYAGTGFRFYNGSKGMSVDQSEENFTLSILPTRRYYWGVDVGISQAIVESYGTVLQAVSAMIDVGVHVGATFQINDKIGVDVLAGASGGFGFSSVGVTGSTTRGLVGLTYSF